MNQTSNILSELNDAKSNFYAENGGKNKFFKKEQKLQLARNISENFELNRLLCESIYLIPETNRIYISYEILKHFASIDIIEQLFQYITTIYNECITKYGEFYIESDLNTVTISGIERLKPFIYGICDRFAIESEKNGFYYADYIIAINFYHIPSSLVQMLRPYMLKGGLHNKLVFFSKEESKEKLKKLLCKE